MKIQPLKPQSNTYTLIDSGDFQKLEQIGPYRVVRPAAQAVWKPTLGESDWKKVDAHFTRFSGGDGRWTINNHQMPKEWTIEVEANTFLVRLTDFGHLGIFPEQHSNWARLGGLIHGIVNAPMAAGKIKGDFSVLNLFAYTGGSTVACALAGAKVVHVDASKTSVAWARENANRSSPSELPVRWIVEDVQKFVGRELRRGSKYQGIILDPPSFGRGTNSEVWNIEEHLTGFLEQLSGVLADDFAFVLLSAHSQGYTPISLSNLMSICTAKTPGEISAEEMVVGEQASKRLLPSGASCLFVADRS